MYLIIRQENNKDYQANYEVNERTIGWQSESGQLL